MLDLYAVSILAIGALKNKLLLPTIIRWLIKNGMIHSNPVCRQAALEAFNMQITPLDYNYRQAMLWVTVPFCIDGNLSIRKVSNMIKMQSLFGLQKLQSLIVPQASDDGIPSEQ